jgi:hypothetical protein
MKKQKLWTNKEYKLDSSILLPELIVNKFTKLFWNEVVDKIDNNQHILVLFRIKYTNNQFSTIGDLQKINKSSFEQFTKDIKNIIDISFDAYKEIPISSVVFSYGIRSGLIPSETSNLKLPFTPKFQIYYNNRLPIAMVPEEYGLIISEANNLYTIITESHATIILTVSKEGEFTVNNIKYFKGKRLLFTWIDTILSFEESKFIRKIGKSVLHYENKNLILSTRVKKTKAMIVKKLVNKKLVNNFITMDLETVTINNNLVPYLISYYNGSSTKSQFILPPQELEDLNNLSEDSINQSIRSMVLDVMKEICNRKYRNYKVYLHNFGKFDGYLLLKHLAQLGKIKPIIHKGKIISCKFKLFESKYWVTFLDSYLMLPSSLKELCKSFEVEDPKGIFPFKLNDIAYQGDVPDYNLFNNLDPLKYNEYLNSFRYKIWNFREEAIKYCELDCISLFQVLSKFNELIFNKFGLNVTNYPTLPSLAMNLFLSKYLKKDTIHMLTGEVSRDIRMGYTGGAVDVYIPKNNPGELVYAYDVNALYPFVMRENAYPVGPPTYFTGDITKVNPNAFGFFYCKIIAPSYLHHPILQTTVETKEGTRNLAPLGNWEGMYFSEELYNAQKYGYKFEIL